MFLGLDMGGTHTDAVLIDAGKIKRHCKIKTDPANYHGTVTRALESLLNGAISANLERLNLSTTVCTNAIVSNNISPVGLLLEPGPGLNPHQLNAAARTFILAGAIDHRGRQTAPLKEAEIRAADQELQAAGIKHLAIVGKFSTRNPDHERKIKQILSPVYDYITLSHRLSGRLNFPRRVYTAYLNSAVAATHNAFATAIAKYQQQKQLALTPDILKADGGTLSLPASRTLPVETILSGPAASIMGALALAPGTQDAIILDIGGTTTDIAFLADGVPLFEPQGINLAGYPTLVRALYSHSLGLGGDSCLRVDGGQLSIGPDRQGAAYALGGPCPTPTDALIALGRLDLGDKQAACKAIARLGDASGQSTAAMATSILEQMAAGIAASTQALLKRINSQPVYTVREVLANKQLLPRRVIVIGAPAAALAAELEAAFNLPVEVPTYAEIANAVGAALSLPTTEITLLADTEQGTLIVPEEGLQQKIPAAFNLAQARSLAQEILKKRLQRLAPAAAAAELEVVEEQSFNMVSGFFTTGKNIRVKAQVKPGVTPMSGSEKHV